MSASEDQNSNFINTAQKEKRPWGAGVFHLKSTRGKVDLR
jgi:hypothetical protein